jgi:hypothetical protein
MSCHMNLPLQAGGAGGHAHMQRVDEAAEGPSLTISQLTDGPV